MNIKEKFFMANVFDVAKYILSKKGTMSTWKLQKLCYYSQAWHYTWTEHPLFANRIEAWANGPVVVDLFNMHRHMFMISDIQAGNISNLSDDEKNSIDIVLRDYGDMEPYALRELTHHEAPWMLARGNLPDNAKCSNEITLDSMGDYYGSL